MKIASISVLHSAASLLAAATAHRHHHHHHHHSDSNFLVATSIPNHRILQGLGDDLSLGFDPMNTAVVIVDPMNDFLHPDGVAWGVVGEAVTEHKTVEHIEMMFKAARDLGFLVFISPHYYYPHDKNWEFEGTLETLMHEIGMFDRADPLSLEGFEGSGADWLEQYKEYIAEENVIVVNPHKVYGPQTNDLVLQLRKRGISRVILGGMSANLCVESHMRELLEQGFEVFVVKDATAGPRHPDLGDGDAAARVNFGYMANGVVNTTEAIDAMGTGADVPDFIVEEPAATNGDRATESTDNEDADQEQNNGAKVVSIGVVVTGTALATLISVW